MAILSSIVHIEQCLGRDTKCQFNFTDRFLMSNFVFVTFTLIQLYDQQSFLVIVNRLHTFTCTYQSCSLMQKIAHTYRSQTCHRGCKKQQKKCCFCLT